LTSLEISLACHSRNIDALVSLTTGTDSDISQDELSWDYCRQLGLGYWLTSPVALSNVLETLARSQYKVRKNPNDCFLLYIAIKKKNILLGLMRSVTKLKQLFELMAQDFTEPKWAKSAAESAFRALSMQNMRWRLDSSSWLQI